MADRKTNIDASSPAAPQNDKETPMGHSERNEVKRRICVGSIGAWVLLLFSMSSAGAGDNTLPRTFKGTDPKGWRQFQWQMTKARLQEESDPRAP